MKRLLVICLTTMLTLSSAFGQDSVKHSLGGSVGITGLRLGISYKAQFQNHFSLLVEGAAGTMNTYLISPNQTEQRSIDVWSVGFSLLSFNISPIFLYDSRSGKQLDWFIGGGPVCGFMMGINNVRPVQVGGLLCVGFEWHSERKPMDVALDLRPSASACLDPYRQYAPAAVFDMPLTVTIRKRF